MHKHAPRDVPSAQRFNRCSTRCFPCGTPLLLTAVDPVLGVIQRPHFSANHIEPWDGTSIQTILKSYCVSSAEYLNKTLTQSIFLKFAEGKDKYCFEIPRLGGKIIVCVCWPSQLSWQGLGKDLAFVNLTEMTFLVILKSKEPFLSC